jgi:hypothetical protein
MTRKAETKGMSLRKYIGELKHAASIDDADQTRRVNNDTVQISRIFLFIALPLFTEEIYLLRQYIGAVISATQYLL